MARQTTPPSLPRKEGVSRRRWVVGTLAVAAATGVAVIVGRVTRRRATPPTEPRAATAGASRPDREPTTLEAVLLRLLPRESGMPGAAEAGVSRYVEAELAKPAFAVPARALQHSMKAFDQAAVARGAKSFATLAAAAQDEVIAAFASGTLEAKHPTSGAVFQILLSLALEGYFGSPRHGGNTDGVAWTAIGFDQACQEMPGMAPPPVPSP